MPIQILMPALSPTMEEGKLAKWLVKEGDTIASGTVIAEIETDKATMEVEAIDEGRLSKILVPEGTEGVKVNSPIAVLWSEDEPRAEAAEAAPHTSVSVVPPAAPPQPLPLTTEARSGARGAAPMPNGHAADRVFASPLARRLAKERGLDLKAVAGSGPHGRIVKRDVEAALAESALKVSPQPQAVAGGAGPATGLAVAAVKGPALSAAPSDDKIVALYDKGSYEVVPHDNMRRVIAERLVISKQTIPHFYLTIDCRLDELLRARERMNASAPKSGARAFKLSVNDFIIKAMALALQQVPAANATWTEGGTLRHRHSDVGVAVAIEGGLFTPVIRHAELKSLSEISNEMKDLADRARHRRLAPHEYQGGTTSISNLGMYGIKSFDAVINPPHATILAVGAGEKRAIVTGDRVEIGTVMSCTLSCDHRVVDGAVGATLLEAFKAYIEDPVRMLV